MLDTRTIDVSFLINITNIKDRIFIIFTKIKWKNNFGNQK